MKKILSFLLAIIGLCGYSQDEYYRKVDWKFYPDNVVQLTDSTYLTDAIPFDYNDPASIRRVIGNYVVDYVGHRYSVIDSTSTTITVLDIYHIGQAPQTGQIARCYRSVGDGEAEYIGSIDYSPLDESSRWKLNGSDNELLWRQTLGKAENGLYKDLRTAKLGGNLIEPTTINQDNNSFKILNNGHGSVFSETGIAYTKIDTVDFTDSTLVTKKYVKSLIKEGTSHDSLTIAAGSTSYFDVNYPQIFSGQKLIDTLGVMNTKIAGKEPILTKGNLTAGSSKVTIGGTGTNAVIGAGASVDVNEANIVHQNLSGHGTNTHAQIDTHITNDGDLSSTNEIQDLSLSGNTLSLSGDASTVDLSGYAPASGSANYIWNQNSVNQNANMWINSGRFGDYGIDIGGDFGTKYGAISIRKNLTGTFANGYHGFEDNSAISITGGLIAYAAFSATPVIVNDLSYDHLVGMQSQPTLSSAASVDRLDGFASGINLGSGGASVNNLAGLHVFDYSGTATVANNYGILLENIDNGTNNYSIYAKSGKMYLGADDIELFYGNLQISGRNKYLFLPTCQGKIGDSEGIFTGGSAFNLGISGYSGAGIDIGTGVTKHIELTNSGETFILNGSIHISAAAKYFMQESSQSKFGDASGIFTGGSGIDTGLSAYSGGNLILGTGVTPHVILANSGLLKINTLSGTGTRLVASQSDGTLANILNASGYLYNDGTNMIWIKTVPQSLSGTTPTLNASNGVNANLSISGATTLTLSNLISGTSGAIYLTNNASVYRIKIAGYTIDPASNITYDSTGILLPASSVWAHTSIGWYYNGTTVQIHKADYNSITY